MNEAIQNFKLDSKQKGGDVGSLFALRSIDAEKARSRVNLSSSLKEHVESM